MMEQAKENLPDFCFIEKKHSILVNSGFIQRQSRPSHVRECCEASLVNARVGEAVRTLVGRGIISYRRSSTRW